MAPRSNLDIIQFECRACSEVAIYIAEPEKRWPLSLRASHFVIDEVAVEIVLVVIIQPSKFYLVIAVTGRRRNPIFFSPGITFQGVRPRFYLAMEWCKIK